MDQTPAASLSRREREVARLVSEGLSNKEIAQRLSLSERTVEGHVASICNKLGFHSRVQIAAWMAQRGDQSMGIGSAASAAMFQRANLPPRWVLAVMLAGLPLPFIAVVYQWLRSPATAPGSAVTNALVTIAAIAFAVVPVVSLFGLATSPTWGATVAVVGLLATGAFVLLVATATLLPAELAGHVFHPANLYEGAYAVVLIPLLLVHALAGLAVAQRHRASRILVSAVGLVWTLRFGYGLTLAALVLWLIWLKPRTTALRK